jgi:hypothetical protein
MPDNDVAREDIRIQLELTEEQRADVREKLGIDGKTMELAIEPLEERVTPIIAVLISL